MTAVPADIDESADILEDYQATVTELRGNLERLSKLVEQQILLETPPCFRRSKSSRPQKFSSDSRAD